MKKVFVLLIVLLVVAQYSFSQAFIGGGLSYQHSTSEIGNSSVDGDTITISPLIGYRFGKFDIGVMFIYEKDTMSNNDMSTIGIGVLGDYNFLTIDKFSILGRTNFQYLNTKITGDDTITTSTSPYYITYSMEQKLNAIGISIAPVFEYKLLKHLTLYTSIGRISFNHSWGEYNTNSTYSSLNTSEKITSNNFGVSISTGITLGFYVFF